MPTHTHTRQSLCPAIHIMFMFSSEILLPLAARRSIVCARSQHLLPSQPAMGMCINSAVIARFVHNFLYVYLFSFDDLQLSPYRTQHIAICRTRSLGAAKSIVILLIFCPFRCPLFSWRCLAFGYCHYIHIIHRFVIA